MTLLATLTHSLQHGAWLYAPLLGFLAGLASSLLPCSVAVLPLLMGYVSSQSASPQNKRSRLASTLLFILGFALILTALGLLSVALGRSMGSWLSHQGLLLLGMLALVMGAQTLGWFHLSFLPGGGRMPSFPWASRAEPFLLGLTYGVLASPCGTPFLVVILGFVAQSRDWLLGGLTLLAYALGQSVLLLLAGWFTTLLQKRAQLAQWGDYLAKIGGLLMVAVGCYLIVTSARAWLPQGS